MISSFYLGRSEYSLGENYSEAVKWFERSAIQAEKSSELNFEMIVASHMFISLIFFEEKVPTIDIMNSHKWLYVAVYYEPDYPVDTIYLWPNPNNMIKKITPFMTYSQIEKAIHLAEDWMVKHSR
ncbi:hypothetical protein [Kiloniella antarctica]|uniref:Uncharacterized protein n=1 Tax=Kiloniella antarctica TaxID=1550907 RepID=A0ABW5BKS2_9PROT